MNKHDKLIFLHQKLKAFRDQDNHFKVTETKIFYVKHWDKYSDIIVKRDRGGKGEVLLRLNRDLFSKDDIDDLANQLEQGYQFVVNQVKGRVDQKRKNFDESFEIQTTDD